jgi:hypothetical protein
VGQLAFVKDDNREYSVFSYGAGWLIHPARFSVSPDLALEPGYQVRKAPGKKRIRASFWRWPTPSPMPGDGESLREHTPKRVEMTRRSEANFS